MRYFEKSAKFTVGEVHTRRSRTNRAGEVESRRSWKSAKFIVGEVHRCLLWYYNYNLMVFCNLYIIKICYLINVIFVIIINKILLFEIISKYSLNINHSGRGCWRHRCCGLLRLPDILQHLGRVAHTGWSLYYRRGRTVKWDPSRDFALHLCH